MKKNVEAVVSAMGALFAIAEKLVKLIKELGGEAGVAIYRLAKPEGEETLKAIAKLIVDGAGVFILEVNHSLTREQLVKALGCDLVDPDFTEENIPLPVTDKKEKVAVELLHLGENVSDEEATKEAKKRGYRRATPREVLALGAKNPDLQRRFPIVATPTARGALCLFRLVAGRCLCVGCVEDVWLDFCRFAVVREQLTP